MNTLFQIYRESSCQHPLISDNDYFFYNQKKSYSHIKDKGVISTPDVSLSSSSCGDCDYIAAFTFLQPKMSIVPPLWSSLLHEFAIEDVKDLQNRDTLFLMCWLVFFLIFR
jgi:hypothetical protein